MPTLGLFRSDNVCRDVTSHAPVIHGRDAVSPLTHVHDCTLHVHLMESSAEVARYKAHLSRLFHRAFHELEALQIRRSGGAAPLARLDIDGLAGS